MDKSDNNRARQLIRKLNRIRHEQAKQIDILCNEMVSAHSDFVGQLRNLNFGIGFYESILGSNDINAILDTTVAHVKTHIPNSNVAVFLADSDGFQLHIVDEDNPIGVDAVMLESYFAEEVVNEICHSKKVSSLHDMIEMGLQGNPSILNKISAAAIPLGNLGPGAGFILIYRSADRKLTPGELQRVLAITGGLTRAIKSCHAVGKHTEATR